MFMDSSFRHQATSDRWKEERAPRPFRPASFTADDFVAETGRSRRARLRRSVLYDIRNQTKAVCLRAGGQRMGFREYG